MFGENATEARGDIMVGSCGAPAAPPVLRDGGIVRDMGCCWIPDNISSDRLGTLEVDVTDYELKYW
jgi:hypothetical protein